MNCPSWQELSFHYDGELESERALTVEEHLGRCLGCRRQWKRLAGIGDALEGQDSIDFPPVARSRKGALAASLLLALLGVGLMLSPGSAPERRSYRLDDGRQIHQISTTGPIQLLEIQVGDAYAQFELE